MSDIPRGELAAALQSLAANNARLCGIAIAADELATEIEKLLETASRTPEYVTWRMKLVRDALEAYKMARQGQ